MQACQWQVEKKTNLQLEPAQKKGFCCIFSSELLTSSFHLLKQLLLLYFPLQSIVVAAVVHLQEGFECYKMVAMRSAEVLLKKQNCKHLENVEIVAFEYH